MGFDPIQHAMCEDTAKQAAKSQRVCGVDKHRISVRMGDIDNADFNVGGIGFTKISPLMPTKEEIAKGTILCAGYDPNTGALIIAERLEVSEVLFDDGTVYGVRLDIIGGATLTFPIFMAVAYRTGSWYDEEITETGIYLHVSGGVEPEMRFTFEYETIHPIDPKFLPPSRYLLNLSSLTIQQGESVMHPSIYDFVGLAVQNGGSFNTTIPAENCKELVTQATEWAKLSRGEDWNWLTSAPQLVVSDNIGILLMPTAIEHQHSTDPGLLQLFVGGTLRVKNGTTWITTHANCTIFFNEDGSIDMFVTATAV